MARKTARPPQLRQGAETRWYRIENLAGGRAEVYVYDEIGYWGVTAADFVAELSELQGVTAIDLHINSPGGEVFDGIAIFNCLRAHPATVTTYVDGLAASIASVIAMAGNRIVMGPHSQLMIHEGSGLCIGDADEMRKMADLLDFQSDNIAAVYAGRAGGDVAAWRDLMRAETWYTAEEAVAAGLADEVAQQAGAPEPVAAGMGNAWDLSVFRHAGRAAAPPPQNAAAEAGSAAAAEPEPEPTPPAAPAAPELEERPTAAEPDTPTEPDTPAPDGDHQQPQELATDHDNDGWAALSAHLTTPATADDAFARLREALL